MFSFSEECTFGDYKGELSSGQTCAEIVHDSPWLCYRDPESRQCCDSCKRIVDGNNKGNLQIFQSNTVLEIYFSLCSTMLSKQNFVLITDA